MKIVYKTLHGSHAYGLNGPKSDLDIRGVYLHEPMDILGIRKPVDKIDGDGEDEVYWELKHFVRMCLQGNPNALEIMFSKPEHQEINLLGPIFDFKNLLLTQHCKNTFGGYAVQNLRLLKSKLATYEKDEGLRKDSMHLVRLLLFSKQILGEHSLKLFFEKTDPNKNMLLSIRAGVIPAIEVVNYAEKTLLEIDDLAKDAPVMEDEVWNLFNTMVAETYWKHLKENLLK